MFKISALPLKGPHPTPSVLLGEIFFTERQAISHPRFSERLLSVHDMIWVVLGIVPFRQTKLSFVHIRFPKPPVEARITFYPSELGQFGSGLAVQRPEQEFPPEVTASLVIFEFGHDREDCQTFRLSESEEAGYKSRQVRI